MFRRRYQFEGALAVAGLSTEALRVVPLVFALVAVGAVMAASPVKWRALAAAEAAVARDPDHAEYRDHLIGLTGTIDRPGPHPDAPSAWAAPRFVAGIAPRPPRRTDFWAGLATQGRVISALLRREALTRYSHTRIGYLWAVLEPIAHLLTLGVLFRIFTQGPPPVGDSLFLFYLTGLIPFLVFWQVSQTNQARTAKADL